MIYVFKDNKHEFYNIVENFPDFVICEKQGKFLYKNDLVPFPWNAVGVYKQGPTTSHKQRINKSDICGKVLKVSNLLITCPNNVLAEQ